MQNLARILKKRSPYRFYFHPDTSVSDAIRVMADNRIGIVSLLEGERIVGVFSERDLVRRVISKGLDLATTQLRDVMTKDPVTASPRDTRTSAILKMRQRGCRHLPVLENGELVDMLSMRDLLRAEIEDREHEIKSLHQYIQGQ